MLDTIPPGRLTSRCALIVSNETSSANYQYGGRWPRCLWTSRIIGSCPRFISLQNPEFTARTFLCHDRLESRFHGAAFVVTLASLVSIYLAPVRDRYSGGGMFASLLGDFQACVFSEWLSLCDRIKGKRSRGAKSIENGFSGLVVSLTLAGLIIGSTCGLVLWLLFRSRRAERTV